MKRNPLYVFAGLDAIGIYDVPLNSTVQINDSDGDANNGITKPKILQLISKVGLFPTSTIQDMLNLTDSFIDINESTEIPSEIEKVTQNGKTGWRVLGRDPSDYIDIGSEAFDFTKSSNVGLLGSPYGAAGDYSFTTGYKTTAGGWSSISHGVETIALNRGSFVSGTYNIGTDLNNIVEIGIGTGSGDRRNALEINTDGTITAPEMTLSNISVQGDRSLVTKEYSDASLNTKYDISGGTINGDVIISGSNPNFDNSLINFGLANFKQGVKFDKDIILGLDPEFNSSIKFSDSIQTAQPLLRWHTSLKDFFVDTHLLTNQRVWHEGNDGINSGLDADTIHGISGTDIATEAYVNNGLSSKFDKIGGDIFGDVTLVGDLDTQGLLTTNRLEVDLNSTFTGSVQINNIANISGDLTLGGGFFLDNIDSNVSFNQINTFNGQAIFNAGISIGADSNRESTLDFTDTGAGVTNPSMYWSTDNNEFYITKTNNLPYNIWHAGNFDPTDPLQIPKGFDDLLDTPSGKVAGSFVKVATNGIDLEYSTLNNDSASWGSIVGDITTQLDLTSALDSKFDKLSGDTIIGPVIFSNTVDLNSNTTINGSCIINGGLDVSNINTSTSFAMDITVDGTTNINSIINLNGSVNIAQNINNRAIINFVDPAINPTITWDQPTSQFVMTNAQGADKIIWNSGNFNPSDKLDTVGGTISGAVTLSSDITVFGNAQFAGTFGVSGAVILNNNLEVQGTSTFVDTTSNNVQVNTAMTVDGTLDVLGMSTLGTSTITGPFQADSVSSFIGDVTVTGLFIASNTVDINGVLNANNAVITMTNLPIVDPAVPGQLWNNAGVLSISL